MRDFFTPPHKALIVRTKQNGLRAFRRETGKQATKPPENPPETRQALFYGMHEYARKVHSAKIHAIQPGVLFPRSSYPKTVNGDAIYCGREALPAQPENRLFSARSERVRRRPALWQSPDDSPHDSAIRFRDWL